MDKKSSILLMLTFYLAGAEEVYEKPDDVLSERSEHNTDDAQSLGKSFGGAPSGGVGPYPYYQPPLNTGYGYIPYYPQQAPYVPFQQQYPSPHISPQASYPANRFPYLGGGAGYPFGAFPPRAPYSKPNALQNYDQVYGR